MVDYDGADHIITILDALGWVAAGLTEPSYYEKHTYKNIETPHNILIEELSITPFRYTDGTIHWNHQISLEFHYSTKATAWGALEFVVKSLNTYTNGTKYINPDTIGVGVRYTESRKIYLITLEINEVKAVT